MLGLTCVGVESRKLEDLLQQLHDRMAHSCQLQGRRATGHMAVAYSDTIFKPYLFVIDSDKIGCILLVNLARFLIVMFVIKLCMFNAILWYDLLLVSG